MKRLVLLGSAFLAACSSTGATNAGSLIAPLDMVIADQPPSGDGDRRLAQFETDAGIPSALVFVTSTDSSELRLFETFRSVNGVSNTDWARAPDPLETLSIPVTDWADTLAVDEGRSVSGYGRRTGAYVYAARRGGQELSIVSIKERRTLVLRAPLPAGMTAMTAWMELTKDELPDDYTTLYLATWDGATGRLFRTKLSTYVKDVTSALAFEQLAAFPGETIQALQMVPSHPDRTLNGVPFCATKTCLALATRSSPSPSRTILVDLDTHDFATLDFGGVVRKFAISMRPDGDRRIYGVLDEERCGGPDCGGVLSVDIVFGNGGVYSRSTDLSNLPMQPIRVGTGLVSGLTVGYQGAILTGAEYVSDGGVGETQEYRGFTELGAFSSSNGLVTYFDPLAGLMLDYRATRATIDQGVLRRPGQLADGGYALVDVDGGTLGTQELATLAWDNYVLTDHTLPWRDVTVTASGMDWNVELFDGYFGTQLVYVVAHGTIPGLTGQNSSDGDGTHLPVATAGYENRALVGDSVRFFTGDSTNGYTECGRATVAAISAAHLDIDAVPSSCVNRVYFDVAAGATQPLVVSGDLEGFMTRGEPGTTMTYERRLYVEPRYVDRVDIFDDAGTQLSWAPRTAFKITTPADVPMEDGAAMTLSLDGYQTPYRVGLDVTTAGACYLTSTTPAQVEFGPIVMGYTPWAQASTLDPLYRWATVGTVPSGNAIVRLFQDQLWASLAGIDNGAYCYQ